MRSKSWKALAALARDLDEGESPCGRRNAEDVVAGLFRFAGRERELPAIDWSCDYETPLWTYHLHYFDYAVDLARAWRASGDQRFGNRYVDLWDEWLTAAERGSARVEPYPTSVRCMNALRSMWLLDDLLPADVADRILTGTRAQLDWLAANLERHLRANHLQKNLTALSWGSLAFHHPPATAVRALEELWRELDEQVLPDGGHYERSPMYHSAALDDFLRTLAMCRTAGVVVPGFVPDRLAAMTRAMQWLSRPDGTLHLFNDAADGARPERHEVLVLARRVLGGPFDEPTGAFALEDTGYFGQVGVDGNRLVIDAGPAGPPYQPGHAHCDMLSFELDIGGHPVVVDSGVHGYDGDPYREYVRSTRAHNTVAIDGRDQHEMWATFRVARRGEVVAAASGVTAAGGYEFKGAARSYHDRHAIHERHIVLDGGVLTVTDRVEGARGRPLTGWLHLHPDIALVREGEAFGGSMPALAAVGEGVGRVRVEPFGADEIVVRRGESDPMQGWHCPAFGRAIPAPALEMRIGANDGRAFGYRLTGG